MLYCFLFSESFCLLVLSFALLLVVQWKPVNFESVLLEMSLNSWNSAFHGVSPACLFW